MRAIHTLTALLLATSCAPDTGEARFEVAQVALQQDCMRRAFPFEPTDLRAQRHPGSTTLFFQNNPGPARSADLLSIELFADNPAAQPLPAAALDRLISAVDGLEDLPDVRMLVDLIIPPDTAAGRSS